MGYPPSKQGADTSCDEPLPVISRDDDRKCQQLFDLELDTTVLVTAFLGIVVGDGLVLAITDRAEAVGRDALADEVVDNGFGTTHGEILVVLGSTHVVGMTADFDLDGLVEFQVLGNLVEIFLGFGGQLGAVEVEEGLDTQRPGELSLMGLAGFFFGAGKTVSALLLSLCKAVLTLLLGLGEAVLAGLLGLGGLFGGLAGGFGCGEGGSIIATVVCFDFLLAEHHAQSEGAAEVGSEFLLTLGEGIAVEGGGLQVGDYADAVGDRNRHHKADTAGRAALLELGVTTVDVRDEPVGDAEHKVGMAIMERVLAIGAAVFGDAEALVAGPEAEPVVEELTDVSLHGGACAVVGVLVVLEFAVDTEVHTATGADEPTGIALNFLFVLSKSRDSHDHGRCNQNDILDFHKAILLEVETNTE